MPTVTSRPAAPTESRIPHTRNRRRGERPVVRAAAEFVLGCGKGGCRWSAGGEPLVESDHQRSGFRVGDGDHRRHQLSGEQFVGLKIRLAMCVPCNDIAPDPAMLGSKLSITRRSAPAKQIVRGVDRFVEHGDAVVAGRSGG